MGTIQHLRGDRGSGTGGAHPRPARPVREGLVVDKALEILGDGPVAEIVIETHGKSCCCLRPAWPGRQLTLRQGGGEKSTARRRPGAAGAGRLRISSQSLSVSPSTVAPTRGCAATASTMASSGGVFVYDGGRGRWRTTTSPPTPSPAWQIKTGGNPTLRRNRIHDGKQAGVLVHEKGRGTLEDNDIIGNALAGVAIRTGGNPTLRRNRIHDSKQGGVFVYDNGQGTLEDNDIIANALAGVEIKTGGNPTLRRNRIHDSKQAGVCVFEDGQGTLEDNDIIANALGRGDQDRRRPHPAPQPHQAKPISRNRGVRRAAGAPSRRTICAKTRRGRGASMGTVPAGS